MTITLIRAVHEGEPIPRGWGLAWWKVCTAEAVLLPIPLNWIAGWGRKLYYRLAQGPRDELAKKWYRRGRAHVCKDQYDIGFKDGEEAAYRRMFPGYRRETIEAIVKERA